MEYNKNLFPFKNNYITIDGSHIHYIDEGQGQVLLFSHPPLASSFMYREFIKILSRKFRCIAFDFPGFGLSEENKNGGYGIVSQSKFIEQFIKILNLSDIIVLGHDTGGPSAFKVAVENPYLFKGLILTDTIIFPTKEYPKINRMLKVVSSGFFQWLNALTNLLVIVTYNFGVQSRKLTKEEKQVYFDIFNTSIKRRRITQVLGSLGKEEKFMEELKSSFENELKDMPMLLIYGENDPVNQLGIPQRIHNMVNRSKLFLIENEGHFPHEGKSLEMSALIEEWIQCLLPIET